MSRKLKPQSLSEIGGERTFGNARVRSGFKLKIKLNSFDLNGGKS